jgi:multidrug efflux pump subunit AcrA (membrane-fusion protein)
MRRIREWGVGSREWGKKTISVILLLAVFSLSGCDRIKGVIDKIKPGGSNDSDDLAAFVQVSAVNTTTAVKGQINDYISLAGDIISDSAVDAYSEVVGKITEVYVSIGQRVTRGQRIAAVDPSRPGMDFQWSYVTAPITGTIISLTAQVGMTVSQALPLVRITGGSGLEIRLYVAERFISKMAMNLTCEITLDAWPGEVFTGHIKELAPVLDAASRTMEVRVHVDNTGSRLKAGMFAKVKIITEHKEGIVKIPASAMLSRFGEQYVYVVEKDPENPEHDIVRKRNVVPGISIDMILEIQSGLEPDEEIVVRGHTLLSDGARVNVVDHTTPLSAN